MTARAQTDMIARLAGGAQSGRAAAAEKALEKIKGEGGLVPKPYVPKRRTFAFPPVERMGQRVLSVRGMTHGYQARRLFNNVDLEIGKGERVAVIGARRGQGWQRARAAPRRPAGRQACARLWEPAARVFMIARPASTPASLAPTHKRCCTAVCQVISSCARACLPGAGSGCARLSQWPCMHP